VWDQSWVEPRPVGLAEGAPSWISELVSVGSPIRWLGWVTGWSPSTTPARCSIASVARPRSIAGIEDLRLSDRFEVALLASRPGLGFCLVWCVVQARRELRYPQNLPCVLGVGMYP